MSCDDEAARLVRRIRDQIWEAAEFYRIACRIIDERRRLCAPIGAIEVHLCEDGRTAVVLIQVGDDWQAIGELPADDPETIEARLLRALAVVEE